MAHVKGHINVPAREMKESETKNSFFESFKNKLPKFEFKKEPVIVRPDKIEIKVSKLVNLAVISVNANIPADTAIIIPIKFFIGIEIAVDSDIFITLFLAPCKFLHLSVFSYVYS